MSSLGRYFRKHSAINYTLSAVVAVFLVGAGLYLISSRTNVQGVAQTPQGDQESTSTATTNGPPKDPTPAEQKAAAAALADLKCPEDYQTEDEIIKAFGDFYYDYSVTNPSANGNIKLLTIARVDFLISHHCTQTLMNMGYSGTGSITPAIRQQLIDSDLKAASS